MRKIQTYINFGLLFCIVFVVLLKIPSLVEPAWHPDEGIYSAVAHELNDGSILYKETWDNKPPSIYYFYAIIYKIFGYNLFFIKLFLIFLTVIGLIFFYKNFKLIFKNINPIIPSLIYVFFFSTPLLDGNVANAENIFVPLSMIGLYFALKAFHEPKLKSFLLFGLFFGIGFTFKIHPVFEYLAIFLFLGINYILNKDLKNIQRLSLSIIGFIFPILIWVIIMFFQGSLGDFVQMLRLMGGYVESGGSSDIVNLILQSLVTRTVIILTLLVVIVFFAFKKKYNFKTNQYISLILLGLVFSVYAVFLSGHEYAHYLLQVIPWFIFVCCIIYQYIKTYNLKIKLIASGILIIFILSLPTLFFYNNLKNGAGDSSELSPSFYRNYLTQYYPNYIKRISGQISQEKYNDQFYNYPNSLYKLIDETRYLKDKEVFVLGELPWYYPLADVKNPTKYTTNFHFELLGENMNEFASLLEQKAEYIITTVSDKKTYLELNKLLDNQFHLDKDLGNFLVYKSNIVGNR